MKGVLKEAGYAALKVCHQVYHCLETDYGDDIIAEGETEKLDRLDEVLKQLVVVKVLDRVGPRAAEHGQYPKRHIVYVNGQGFEWLEDLKHLAAIIRNRSKAGAKPQSSPGSNDLGKSDPEALDDLEEVEGKLYQQDTGISIYQSSTCKAGKIPCGYREACAQIRSSKVRRHCEKCRRLRLGWKRGTLIHERRAGIPWRTSRGFVGCIRSSASIEFRRSRALRNRESSQSTCTRRWDEPSTSTSKRARRMRSGCVPSGCWKDQTHSSSLVVDPRRHS